MLKPSNIRCTLALFAIFAALPLSVHAQFTNPTPEELKMTSIPEVPGAPAVYLYKEDITEDYNHMHSYYFRIKVLTEAGKKYGNVSVPFYTAFVANDAKFSSNPRAGDRASVIVADIEARTVHADGTVVNMTAAPVDQLVAKEGDTAHRDNVTRYMKVFALPDVQVGSIIEYRYKLRWEDYQVHSPEWYIQSDLFTRKAHYVWKPFTLAGPGATDQGARISGNNGQLLNMISWSMVLPKGADIKQSELPPNVGVVRPGEKTIELTMENILPIPHEQYMPPITNTGYRVLFYYTAFRDSAQFWQNTGSNWSAGKEKFLSPDPAINLALQKITTPADSQETQLRKIYAAVMTVENTDFTRQHTNSEGPNHTAADVWTHKSGDSEQITELFVALARAAGMKAYVMAVANRERRIFISEYLSAGQLEDEVAIVNVGGVEKFFDPGERYTPYGHLSWQHAGAKGMRQLEGGATSITQETPTEPYTASRTRRAADLTLAADGSVSGPLTLVFTGNPAIEWRQKALATDDTGIRDLMKLWMQDMMPPGLEVQPPAIDKLADYEQPLTVQFLVKGRIAGATAKRVILPADLFEATEGTAFTEDKRDTPIDFHYSSQVSDATRIKFPAGFSIESAPAADKLQYLKSAEYSFVSDSTPASITVRRDAVMADIIVPQAEYAQLKAYYSRLEQKDKESIVIKLP